MIQSPSRTCHWRRRGRRNRKRIKWMCLLLWKGLENERNRSKDAIQYLKKRPSLQSRLFISILLTLRPFPPTHLLCQRVYDRYHYYYSSFSPLPRSRLRGPLLARQVTGSNSKIQVSQIRNKITRCPPHWDGAVRRNSWRILVQWTPRRN